MIRSLQTVLRAPVLAVALATCALAQESRPFVLPARQFGPFETSAQLLARSGWGAEAEELAGLMKALGYGEAPTEKLVKLCKTEAKGKKRTPVPAIIKTLKTATQQIAKLIPAGAADSRPSPESQAAAEAILAIDGSIESLHRLLGREKTATGWRAPEDLKAAARRAEIQAALTKARRLEVETTAAEDTEALIKDVHGSGCNKVSARGITIWSRWPQEKLRRVLREALRGLAVSNYLLRGELTIPLFQENIVLFEGPDQYKRAVDAAKAKGWIDDKEVEEAKKLSGFHVKRPDLERCKVGFMQTEADAEASVTYSCCGYTGALELPPPLRVGHVNWLCLTYFGIEMPGVAFTEEVGEKRQRRTAAGADPTDERRQVLRLAEAGIAGSRSWLAYLAAHGEDPPFAASIVDQDGKIEGKDRLKCTFVAEFLQEHDQLRGLDLVTTYGTREGFEKALGSFAAFEARWRRWLLGARLSLVERLDPPKPRGLSPAETDLVSRLNEHRRRCFKGSICGDFSPPDVAEWPSDLVDNYQDVGLDDALSDGARKHALYLGKHPEQMAAWPDAHEEWPDREGFTAEGGWAGLHSVIAPGAKSPEDALNGWLGTFYHRLPLIHPGLMRIGWALTKDVAVLDSGSLARPVTGSWHVVWPYDGMTDVPTRFAPELPNPVPGVDQSTFGYPVTLQIHAGQDPPVTITIELREGGPKGPEVACHVSTPTKPSNPDLSLSDAWCLIPKEPLKASTTYAVTATWSDKRKISWSFKTGK